MADVGGPNHKLTVARLEMEIQQQLMNIKASRYRQIQLSEESTQIDKNIAAAEEAMAALEQELKETKERVE